MIILFIFLALFAVIKLVFNVLPSLPAMPVQIIEAGGWFIDVVSHATGFFKYLYGSVFFNIIITLLIGLLAFEQIYHFTLWILKKIPAINVK